MTSAFTLRFAEIGKADHGRVGGKCASLGEMTQAGVAVPPGFAVTTDAYLSMLDGTRLRDEVEAQLARIDFDSVEALDRAAQAISHTTEEIKFDSEWSQQRKDAAIVKLKEYCANRR